MLYIHFEVSGSPRRGILPHRRCHRLQHYVDTIGATRAIRRSPRSSLATHSQQYALVDSLHYVIRVYGHYRCAHRDGFTAVLKQTRD